MKLQLEERLPEASVAEQLTVVDPFGNTEPDGGLHATLGFGSQLSLAVAANVAVAPVGPAHSTVLVVGQLIVGAVLSTTFNANVHKLLLPAASVNVTVTVCVPTPAIVPAEGFWDLVKEADGVQLSEALIRPVRSGIAA